MANIAGSSANFENPYIFCDLWHKRDWNWKWDHLLSKELLLQRISALSSIFSPVFIAAILYCLFALSLLRSDWWKPKTGSPTRSDNHGSRTHHTGNEKRWNKAQEQNSGAKLDRMCNVLVSGPLHILKNDWGTPKELWLKWDISNDI